VPTFFIKEALLTSIYTQPLFYAQVRFLKDGKMDVEQNGMKNAIPIRNTGTRRGWRNGEQPVNTELYRN
jgi:hypothetical protein